MNDQAISYEYRLAHREEYQSMLAYRREMLELQRIERQLEAQQRIVEQARERAEGAHVDYCEQIQVRQDGSSPTKKRTHQRNAKT